MRHLIRRCEDLIKIASPSAARFPLSAMQLLHKSLALRDRHQLGSGKAAVLDVRAQESEKSFQLVIATAEKRISGGMDHFTFSTLMQRTESRKIVHSLAISELAFPGSNPPRKRYRSAFR